MHFDVEEIILAYPEYMMIDRPLRVIVPVDEFGYHPSLAMQVGESYLIRGIYDRVMALFGQWSSTASTISHYPEDLYLFPRGFAVVFRPLHEDYAYFYPVSNPGFDKMLLQLENRIENLCRNMRSIFIQTTKDMTSMHSNHAHVGTIGFPMGRWITYEDYLNANPVIVLHSRILRLRGLEIGDSITVTLREYAFGVLPYAYDDWRNYRTHTLDLEIIGTFGYRSLGIDFSGAAWANSHPGDPMYFRMANAHGITGNHFASHFAFIPTSLIPEGFVLYHDNLPWDNQFSFVLNTARDQRAFVEQNREALGVLGYNVHFVPMPGAVDFFFAVDNILLALGFNLIIFSVTSALMLALAVFIYMASCGGYKCCFYLVFCYWHGGRNPSRRIRT